MDETTPTNNQPSDNDSGNGKAWDEKVVPLSAFNDSGRTKDRGVECEFCSGFETKLMARNAESQLPAEERLFKLQKDGSTPPVSPRAEHDLVSRIAEFLGTSPAELARAEELLTKFKYDIAKFVMLEEYNLDNPISLSTALWLEARTNPDKLDELQETAKAYL